MTNRAGLVWTCPACAAALRLTLLFHSSDTWTHEREVEWISCIRTIEQATGRAIFRDKPEATSRVLCDAIRAVLEDEA